MPAGLDTAHRTAAKVAAIRAPYPGTDTLAPRAAQSTPLVAEALAPVVHLTDRTTRPARDGAERPGQLARIDGQNRIHLGKVLGPLGWRENTFLVAAREGGHVVVRAGADSPLVTAVPVDTARRLTLPPMVLATLDAHPGQQVLAAAVLNTGELHLMAAADVLQVLTGAVSIAAPPPAPPSRLASGSRIRRAWQPGDGDTNPGR